MDAIGVQMVLHGLQPSAVLDIVAGGNGQSRRHLFHLCDDRSSCQTDPRRQQLGRDDETEQSDGESLPCLLGRLDGDIQDLLVSLAVRVEDFAGVHVTTLPLGFGLCRAGFGNHRARSRGAIHADALPLSTALEGAMLLLLLDEEIIVDVEVAVHNDDAPHQGDGIHHNKENHHECEDLRLGSLRNIDGFDLVQDFLAGGFGPQTSVGVLKHLGETWVHVGRLHRGKSFVESLMLAVQDASQARLNIMEFAFQLVAGSSQRGGVLVQGLVLGQPANAPRSKFGQLVEGVVDVVVEPAGAQQSLVQAVLEQQPRVDMVELGQLRDRRLAHSSLSN
mmetsp:Transcript_95258/g.199225  ORF Transcript_95258/g.199225 Transcript_95258/m.199225 type:complete len:334 (+) Transcript_95258:597-1598(+)